MLGCVQRTLSKRLYNESHLRVFNRKKYSLCDQPPEKKQTVLTGRNAQSAEGMRAAAPTSPSCCDQIDCKWSNGQIAKKNCQNCELVQVQGFKDLLQVRDWDDVVGVREPARARDSRLLTSLKRIQSLCAYQKLGDEAC